MRFGRNKERCWWRQQQRGAFSRGRPCVFLSSTYWCAISWEWSKAIPSFLAQRQQEQGEELGAEDVVGLERSDPGKQSLAVRLAQSFQAQGMPSTYGLFLVTLARLSNLVGQLYQLPIQSNSSPCCLMSSDYWMSSCEGSIALRRCSGAQRFSKSSSLPCLCKPSQLLSHPEVWEKRWRKEGSSTFSYLLGQVIPLRFWLSIIMVVHERPVMALCLIWSITLLSAESRRDMGPCHTWFILTPSLAGGESAGFFITFSLSFLSLEKPTPMEGSLLPTILLSEMGHREEEAHSKNGIPWLKVFSRLQVPRSVRRQQF